MNTYLLRSSTPSRYSLGGLVSVLTLLSGLASPLWAQVITTLAGTGTQGYSGDGALAIHAQLNYPAGMVIDGQGNCYFADQGNHRIRKVSPAGLITTVAGDGTWGYGGDGGAATQAQLRSPIGVAVDSQGNLFIADTDNHCIRKVTPAGLITTVAGDGTWGYGQDNGLATRSRLANPSGLAIDGQDNLFIAERGSHRIRRISAAGVITTVAGDGNEGIGGDGGAATQAQLDAPNGVAVDNQGNLFIADTYNHCVRKVSPAGLITTVAGIIYGGFIGGYGGDGGAATEAQLSFVDGVAVDSQGNLFIADQGNHRIRRVSSSGIITTLAGNGTGGYSGDGGAASSAYLYHPTSVILDGQGNLLIADQANQRIRQVMTKVSPSVDLTPVLYARPTTLTGDDVLSVVVDVVELNGVTTSGLTTLKITRDAQLALDLPTSATSVGNHLVQNSVWQLSLSDPAYYVLTTTQPIGGGDKLSVGLTGTLVGGGTAGVLTLSGVLVNVSGELRTTNNIDSDKIDYFQP